MKCLNAYCQNQSFTASGLCGSCEQASRSSVLPSAHSQMGLSANRSAAYAVPVQERAPNLSPIQRRYSFSDSASEYRPEGQPRQAVQALSPPPLLQAPVAPVPHNRVAPRCCCLHMLKDNLLCWVCCALGGLGGCVACGYPLFALAGLPSSSGTYGCCCGVVAALYGVFTVGGGIPGAGVGMGTAGLINCCRACAHEGRISIQCKHCGYGGWLNGQQQVPAPQAALQLQPPALPLPLPMGQEGQAYLRQPPAPPVRQEGQSPVPVIPHRVELLG